MERLQKVIANAGFISRRKAEELIRQGRVFVDGVKVVELGTKVAKGQMITIDGKMLEKEEKEYYLLNKPRGVVTTTSDDKHRKTVVDLIPTDKRIYPVGRLDYDTTGLLILTNDGELANLLTDPKQKIEKEYIVKVKGIVGAKQIIPLQQGILLDGVKCIPRRVKLRKVDKEKDTSMIELTICEGKNHEIKRMMASVGLEVLKLKRERIGFLTLGNLPSGKARKLTVKEVKKLYQYQKPKQK